MSNQEQEWEFKIMRSNTGAFGNPAKLQAMLEEQALTGWEFQEKFDSYRVRLKRPVSARSRDIMLPEGIDPYSTQHGGVPGKVIGIVLGVLLLVVGMAVFLASRSGGTTGWQIPMVALSVILLVVLAAFVGIKSSR